MKKTVSYGIMHFAVAFIISYIVTGNIAIAGTLAVLEPFVQTIAYHFHEKFWALKNKAKEIVPVPEEKQAVHF